MINPLASVQMQIDTCFPPETHPYRIFERVLLEYIGPELTVLDIGCGRTAPNLSKLTGKAKHLIGIDLVNFQQKLDGLLLTNEDVYNMRSIGSGSVDVAYSRAVVEHLKYPSKALAEIYRVLKDEGFYIFLTPSIYDYASLISLCIPNKLHPTIVNFTEGRNIPDVFPAYYRSNSRKSIVELAQNSGFNIVNIEYLGQYPCYLTFSRSLFWLGCLYQRIISRYKPLHPLQGWVLSILKKHRSNDCYS